MKIKKNFALRTIAGMQVVFPLSEQTLNFNGMLTLNESGVMLWKMLEGGCTQNDMVNALIERYDVGSDEALADVKEFVNKIEELGYTEE